MRARLLVMIALLFAGEHAWAAADSVSLLGVGGKGAEHFGDALEQDLSELYRLVPGEVYRRTAEHLQRRGASPAEVHAVCTALRLDAIIAGTVSGDADQRALVIVVREGQSGEIVSRRRYDLGSRTLAQVREEVLRDIVRALEPVPPIFSVRKRPAVAQQEEEEPENEAPESSEARGQEETSIEVSTPIDVPPPHNEPAHRPFYFGAGLALMGRGLSFDAPGATGYHGNGIGAVRIEGGAFPLAFSQELASAHPVLAALGLVGNYERAFAFNSSSAQLSSSQSYASRWSALLVARVPLGHESRGGTLTLEGGFQRISWSAASQNSIGVPDVSYALVDLGLGWSHILGSRRVELAGRFAALAIVDAGNITGETQYGRGRGGGFDFEVGLIVRPTRWLWLRLAGEYTPLFMTFNAEGSKLAHRSADQFGDGVLEVGFAL